METISELEQTNKKRIIARVNGTKLIKNIANYGIKENECAIVSRNGIYSGLTIQALENYSPILTTANVTTCIKLLLSGDVVSATRELNVERPHELYYLVRYWLEKYEFSVPDVIENVEANLDIDIGALEKRANFDVGSVLPFKFKITDVGKGKTHTVVPESWMGRIFKDGYHLHAEMNKLPWRETDPEVRWCCTFGMLLMPKQLWMPKKDILLLDTKPSYGILIAFDQKKSTTFYDFSKIDMAKWVDDMPVKYECIVNTDLVIACDKNALFCTPKHYPDVKMSILASQLQKCFRRGKPCRNLLEETMKRLRNCLPYNLPEHNFLLVSGSKQLLWRTYISIIEDISPYKCNTVTYSCMISLDTIFALSLVCHLDSSLQINDDVLTKLICTGSAIQAFPLRWNWRDGNVADYEYLCDNDDEVIVSSMKFALKYMPKMAGDTLMLKKSINYMSRYTIPVISLDNWGENKSDIVKETICRYESIDMHCHPNIILLVQGSLPNEFVGKLSTHYIPKIIWDNISRKTFRTRGDKKDNNNDGNLQVVEIVKHIQKYLYDTKYSLNRIAYNVPLKNEIHEFANAFKNKVKSKINKSEIPEYIGRIGFLQLFGKKIIVPKNGKMCSIEVIIGGTKDDPLKIKKTSVKSKCDFIENIVEKQKYQTYFFEFIKDTKIPLQLPEPPIGYTWTFHKKQIDTKVYFSVDNCADNNCTEFMADDIIIPPFDARKVLKRNEVLVESGENEFLSWLIKHALYLEQIDGINEFEINQIMRYVWNERNQTKNYILYKWGHLKLRCDNRFRDVWNILCTRIVSNNHVCIGPVDRSGNKTQNSISYMYEGFCWRFMNMLSMIYPSVIKLSGNFKFNIQRNVCGYDNLIESLMYVPNIKKNVVEFKPKITTKLWDHQQTAVDKIIYGITNNNKLGHCDASDVGSGKTLTALATFVKLLEIDMANKSNYGYGMLVLLPTEKLYKTWEEEINKHTNNLDVCFQSSNGKFTKEIKYSSVVITTLGRMRDHPIIHMWLYVVIDECLSVQNSTTLHTEEAWRQVANSKYGVLLLSATFFRSRFNKLLYMLKMLRTKIPEKMEYLDIILNETLICNLCEKSRKWITNVNYFDLPDQIRVMYDKIKKMDLSSEDIYVKLNKLMFDKCDYVECYRNVVDKITSQNKRALLYARSKHETKLLSRDLHDVSIYPDKSARHCVVSYTDGTYGVNDLVDYNVIITRPPDADKLPQMKGRLDRPNQNCDVLQIEYILFKNTIEDAMLYKLDMAKKFFGHYIMPHADFYRLAVSY